MLSWGKIRMHTIQEPSERLDPIASIRHSTESPKLSQLWEKLSAIATRHAGFLALGDQGVVSATNFATGLIIGRFCSKEELGLYMLGWTLVIIATEISAALITTPYTVFSPALGQLHLRRYRASMLAHQCILSGLFVALIIVAATATSWLDTANPLPKVLWSLAGVILFILVRDFIRRVCFAHLKMLEAIALDCLSCVFQIGGLLLLAGSGYLSASSTYFVLGGASALACITWIVRNKKSLSLEARSWFTDAQHSWSLGRWILASGLVWAGAMYLYPWILALFHGTASTGTWAACYSVVALGNPVLLGFGNYIGPKVANIYAAHGVADMRRYVYRTSVGFALLLLPVSLALLGWGGVLVAKMYGGAYAGNSIAVSLLAINLLLSALAFPCSRGLFVLRLAKVDLVVNLIAIALLFTVGLQLVRWYSVTGAALALTLSNAATLGIRILAFSRGVRAAAAA
jgi:O-antigen/teichoic acid export membrane protein